MESVRAAPHPIGGLPFHILCMCHSIYIYGNGVIYMKAERWDTASHRPVPFHLYIIPFISINMELYTLMQSPGAAPHPIGRSPCLIPCICNVMYVYGYRAMYINAQHRCSTTSNRGGSPCLLPLTPTINNEKVKVDVRW